MPVLAFHSLPGGDQDSFLKILLNKDDVLGGTGDTAGKGRQGSGLPPWGFPSGGGIRWQQVLEAKGPGGRRGCFRDGEQEAHSGEGVPDKPASCLLWAPSFADRATTELQDGNELAVQGPAGQSVPTRWREGRCSPSAQQAQSMVKSLDFI